MVFLQFFDASRISALALLHFLGRSFFLPFYWLFFTSLWAFSLGSSGVLWPFTITPLPPSSKEQKFAFGQRRCRQHSTKLLKVLLRKKIAFLFSSSPRRVCFSWKHIVCMFFVTVFRLRKKFVSIDSAGRQSSHKVWKTIKKVSFSWRKSASEASYLSLNISRVICTVFLKKSSWLLQWYLFCSSRLDSLSVVLKSLGIL